MAWRCIPPANQRWDSGFGEIVLMIRQTGYGVENNHSNSDMKLQRHRTEPFYHDLSFRCGPTDVRNVPVPVHLVQRTSVGPLALVPGSDLRVPPWLDSFVWDGTGAKRPNTSQMFCP